MKQQLVRKIRQIADTKPANRLGHMKIWDMIALLTDILPTRYDLGMQFYVVISNIPASIANVEQLGVDASGNGSSGNLLSSLEENSRYRIQRSFL